MLSYIPPREHSVKRLVHESPTAGEARSKNLHNLHNFHFSFIFLLFESH